MKSLQSNLLLDVVGSLGTRKRHILPLIEALWAPFPKKWLCEPVTGVLNPKSPGLQPQRLGLVWVGFRVSSAEGSRWRGGGGGMGCFQHISGSGRYCIRGTIRRVSGVALFERLHLGCCAQLCPPASQHALIRQAALSMLVLG